MKRRKLTCAKVYQLLQRCAMTFKELAYALRHLCGRVTVWKRLNELRRKGMIQWDGKGNEIVVI